MTLWHKTVMQLTTVAEGQEHDFFFCSVAMQRSITTQDVTQMRRRISVDPFRVVFDRSITANGKYL
jgi:hypothetical protein